MDSTNDSSISEKSNLPESKNGNPTLASRWKRLGAVLIDVIVALPVILVVELMTGFFRAGFERALQHGGGYSLEDIVVIFAGGQILFLLLHGYLLAKRGQTIGKSFLNIRIVDLQGKIPPLGRLYGMRYFLPTLISQVPFIGGIFGLVNALFIFGAERRCLHDRLAGTRVVDLY